MRLGVFVAVLVAGMPSVYAWGERGHDIVTRVAVRLVLENRHYKELHKPLSMKEHMLAHLASTPDTYWRSKSVSASVRKANAPMHYVHMNKVGKDAILTKNMPKSKRALAKVGIDLVADLGSSPWRIHQLASLMAGDFKRVKESRDEKGRDKAVISALTHAGLLSHFVADLANPEHATSDFDGWDTGQGGLHSYFESACVYALDLGLAGRVFDRVRSNPKLLDRIYADIPPRQDEEPFAVAIALAKDSLAMLKELQRLDAKFALLKKSSIKNGLRVPAKRRPAKEVAKHFEGLIVDRLAVASQVLAILWSEAWKKGGAPDLSQYSSFEYVFTPKFIPMKS